MKEFFQDDFGAAKDNYDDNQSWLANQDFSRENEQMNGVRKAEPWTVQVGLSGSGGVGGGGTVGAGVVIARDDETGDLDVGMYSTAGGGGFAGLGWSVVLDIITSDNNEIKQLNGISGVSGFSVGEGLVGGYEISVNKGAKSSQVYSAGIGGGLSPVEFHGFMTGTKSTSVGELKRKFNVGIDEKQ